MLKVILKNGFEFEVDMINEVSGGSSNNNTAEVIIRSPLGADSAKVRENMTAENLSRLVVTADGEQIDEYEGYTDIRSINKVITKFERSLTIQAAKGE